ncbi:MAG: S8 family serine peptidase, partial [Candidatus Sumerlaeota bacterium]|nr:S8 family serine peptidase [Candidatus Sumerlaeota bacterium]
MNLCLCIFRAAVIAFLALALAAPLRSQSLVPPAEPSVKPLIGKTYSNDLDADGVEDQLRNRANQAELRMQAAASPQARLQAQAEIEQMVSVELVFSKQITQQQINAFQAAGGKIDYLYKSVSYGWNGQIPLGNLTRARQAMGADLALIQESKPAVLHMDLATQTGRVRPVWASGFAGNSSGYSGASSITIAIVDTGVDETHTDLNGRRVYWHDFSTDALASPIDMVQHGSHVAGIALGTGAASGATAGTLYYTDEGDLTSVPNGSFYPSPIALPGVSLTYSSTAKWLGGGSTSLYQFYHSKGVSGGWTAISAASAGASPLTETNSFTGNTTRAYSAGLVSNGGTVKQYVITNSATNYPTPGDGFNRLRGVAPGCNWAAAKVFTNAGSGQLSWTASAVDDLVTNRVANNIKVMNLSLGAVGDPGLDTTTRQKINTAVNNGIVVVVSAGNDGTLSSPGKREVDDPGRAAMALTVAATNDNNQITDYSSQGFASPGSTSGQEEDYKPDVAAPGGSGNY